MRSAARCRPSEVSSFWTGRALGFITSQPLRVAAADRPQGPAARQPHRDARHREPGELRRVVVRRCASLGWFGALRRAGAAGGARRDRDLAGSPAPVVLHALALAYAASVVMFYVFARYRYPLVPFLLLFAAAPFDSRVRDSSRARSLRACERWRSAAVASRSPFFRNWPLLSPTLMLAITENNLGTALQEQRPLRRGDRALHERAIALQPDYAPAYNNLGAALRAAGRLDEAVARYRQALALKPDFASASYNLANALLEQGQAGDSAEQLPQRRSSRIRIRSRRTTTSASRWPPRATRAGAIAEFRAALAIDDRSVARASQSRQHAGRRRAARRRHGAPRARGAARAVGARSALRHRHDPAAGAELRRRRGAFEAALKHQPGLGRGAQQPRHRARPRRDASPRRSPTSNARSTLEPRLADARANRDQARAALKLATAYCTKATS